MRTLLPARHCFNDVRSLRRGAPERRFQLVAGCYRAGLPDKFGVPIPRGMQSKGRRQAAPFDNK
jgi:hypothetical protein